MLSLGVLVGCDSAHFRSREQDTGRRGREQRDCARPSAGTTGLSLVELLIIIAVIAIITSLAMSGIKMALTASRKVACQANLRQLGLAAISYASDWRGRLPALKDTPSASFWLDRLQPYLDDQQARAGTLSGARTVQWGCHPWRGNFAGGYGQSNNNTGYGMNPWLNLPTDDSTCDLVNTLNLVPATGTRKLFLLASISHPGQRLLFGDSNNFFLPRNILGDPPAHAILTGNVRVGSRHGTQNNYLFVDGRVGLVSNARASFAITNPPQFFEN